jgi:hypothetical protein
MTAAETLRTVQTHAGEAVVSVSRGDLEQAIDQVDLARFWLERARERLMEQKAERAADAYA